MKNTAKYREKELDKRELNEALEWHAVELRFSTDRNKEKHLKSIIELAEVYLALMEKNNGRKK